MWTYGGFLFLLFSSLCLCGTGADSAHSQQLLGVKLIKPVLNEEGGTSCRCRL